MVSDKTRGGTNEIVRKIKVNKEKKVKCLCSWLTVVDLEPAHF